MKNPVKQLKRFDVFKTHTLPWPEENDNEATRMPPVSQATRYITACDISRHILAAEDGGKQHENIAGFHKAPIKHNSNTFERPVKTNISIK